uniref:Uncharacterized protein n=1 Tax=Setaria viridis TaxID=4556 RepID=A0A4U6SU74_SETVI|nr:hypothetical protein SEVIR_9G106432v2 [Setaria viridis]
MPRRKWRRKLQFRRAEAGGRRPRSPLMPRRKWRRKLQFRRAGAGGRRQWSPLKWRRRKRKKWQCRAVAGRERLQRRRPFHHSRKIRGQRELLLGEVKRWRVETMRGRWMGPEGGKYGLQEQVQGKLHKLFLRRMKRRERCL